GLTQLTRQKRALVAQVQQAVTDGKEVWIGDETTLRKFPREELTHLSHQAIGRVALRAQMGLLSDRGFTVPQIATIHACGEEGVRPCLERSQSLGVASLEDEPRSGRPLKHPLEGWSVDTQASPSPPVRALSRPAGRCPCSPLSRPDAFACSFPTRVSDAG